MNTPEVSKSPELVNTATVFTEKLFALGNGAKTRDPYDSLLPGKYARDILDRATKNDVAGLSSVLDQMKGVFAFLSLAPSVWPSLKSDEYLQLLNSYTTLRHAVSPNINDRVDSILHN